MEIKICLKQLEEDYKIYRKLSTNCPNATLCTEHYMTKFCRHEYYTSRNYSFVECNRLNCMIARKDEFNR